MDRNGKALRASWLGFCCNLFLTLLKIFGGIVGRSSALLADGINSSSDVITDLVAIWGFRAVARPQDWDHRYGHGKFETLASAAVGLSLMLVAGGIFWDASSRALEILRGLPVDPPKGWTLAIILVTVFLKGGLYVYCDRTARETDSDMLRGKAWDHRSDVFASLGTLAGVGGALWLGRWGALMDPAAGLIVSLMVAWVAFRIIRSAADELAEGTLPPEVTERIQECVLSAPGVRGMHRLRCRRLGSYYAMDFHVFVDPLITVREGHDIASAVEEKLRRRFGPATLLTVHVEPNEGNRYKQFQDDQNSSMAP